MKYHKINSIFKRDERTKRFTNEYSCEEFSFLRNNEWIGTEKIDGTNIRFVWDGQECKIGGRTDNAMIPSFLLPRLEEIRSNLVEKVFRPGESMVVFGEGYGAKIQKGGGNYIPDGVDFILFDVSVGEWWLKRDAVDGIAQSIGVKSVPVLFCGTLKCAIDMVADGFDSTIGTAKAEGLILIPKVELKARDGSRIITKIKTRDFR